MNYKGVSLTLEPEEPTTRGADTSVLPELIPYIQEASEKTGLEPNLIKAVIEHESVGGRDLRAKGSSAYGPMQIIYGTAKELGINRYDPRENIIGGSQYLKQQIDTFGGVKEGLAAYFKGPGKVKQYGLNIPGTEGGRTVDSYYNDILRRKQKLDQQSKSKYQGLSITFEPEEEVVQKPATDTTVAPPTMAEEPSMTPEAQAMFGGGRSRGAGASGSFGEDIAKPEGVLPESPYVDIQTAEPSSTAVSLTDEPTITGKEALGIVGKGVATGLVAAGEQVPGVKTLQKITGGREEAIRMQQESPTSAAVGGFLGNVALVIGGASLATKKLAATAISPMWQAVIRRAGTQAALATGQNVESVAIGEKDLRQGIEDVVVRTGASLASLIPETALPSDGVRILAQLPAQVGTDVAFDALVALKRGQKLDADWVLQSLPSWGMSAGFALLDIKSGDSFRATQKAIRNDAKGTVKRAREFLKAHPEAKKTFHFIGPDGKLTTEISPERLAEIDAMVKQDIDRSVAPIKPVEPGDISDVETRELPGGKVGVHKESPGLIGAENIRREEAGLELTPTGGIGKSIPEGELTKPIKGDIFEVGDKGVDSGLSDIQKARQAGEPAEVAAPGDAPRVSGDIDAEPVVSRVADEGAGKGVEAPPEKPTQLDPPQVVLWDLKTGELIQVFPKSAGARSHAAGLNVLSPEQKSDVAQNKVGMAFIDDDGSWRIQTDDAKSEMAKQAVAESIAPTEYKGASLSLEPEGAADAISPDSPLAPIKGVGEAGERLARADEMATKAQAELAEMSQRGAVAVPDAPVKATNEAMEAVFGHFRAFGRQYVSDKPLASRFEQAFHERVAGVEKGISDVDKAMKAAGDRSLNNSLKVVFALEEAGISKQDLPADAHKLYDVSKKVIDDLTALEQKTGTLGEGFPEGTRNNIKEQISKLAAKGTLSNADVKKINELREDLDSLEKIQGEGVPEGTKNIIREQISKIEEKEKLTDADVKKMRELREDLASLEKFQGYLPHSVVARRVMQSIYENGNSRQKRNMAQRLEQFHRQRKGRATLREYIESDVISAEDADIGKLLMTMAVSTNQKVAMKSLVDYGQKNNYIVTAEEPPNKKDWFDLSQLATSAQVYKMAAPKGEKVWVHRLFGLGLEELSGANRIGTNVFDKALSISKVGQFYKPNIIWAYNMQQRIYGGAVELNPVKDARNTIDAWRSVLSQDETYQEASRLGIFQAPDNIPRSSIDKQIDVISRKTRSDIARGGKLVNRFKKVLEQATGEKMDYQAWKDKEVNALVDGLMLPIRATANATWAGDKVQRLHTYLNLTRKGMEPKLAAEQTAKMHGAYSKIGRDYKNWASRLFFVHSFRMLMPIQTVRSYWDPVKLSLDKMAGKPIPKGEARRVAGALAGTILFPTLIDSALRSWGWENTEEEKELFEKTPLRFLRVPIGDTKYKVTLALPNWKYKKTFNYRGEDREVVVGINNIVNMATKWIVRGQPRPQAANAGIKELPIYSLLKWEINPMYRTAIDIFENESSFGDPPPRGAAGDDWGNAAGYLFGSTLRLYGDAMRLATGEPESNVYKKRQRAELERALSFGERVMTNVFGYAYTRAEKGKRGAFMLQQLNRNIESAKRNAEKYFEGERLDEEVGYLEGEKIKRTLKILKQYPNPDLSPSQKIKIKRSIIEYNRAQKKEQP